MNSAVSEDPRQYRAAESDSVAEVILADLGLAFRLPLGEYDARAPIVDSSGLYSSWISILGTGLFGDIRFGSISLETYATIAEVASDWPEGYGGDAPDPHELLAAFPVHQDAVLSGADALGWKALMWGDRNSLAQCSYEGSGASYVYQAITFVDTLRIGVILFYEPPALLSGAHLKSIEAMCDTLRPDFQALVERIQFAHIRQGAGTAAQQRVAPDDPR